jgi:hypothetical protein
VAGPTDEEVFQQQLEQAIELSKVEGESKAISEELSPRGKIFAVQIRCYNYWIGTVLDFL